MLEIFAKEQKRKREFVSERESERAREREREREREKMSTNFRVPFFLSESFFECQESLLERPCENVA